MCSCYSWYVFYCKSNMSPFITVNRANSASVDLPSGQQLRAAFTADPLVVLHYCKKLSISCPAACCHQLSSSVLPSPLRLNLKCQICLVCWYRSGACSVQHCQRASRSWRPACCSHPSGSWWVPGMPQHQQCLSVSCLWAVRVARSWACASS